MTEREYGALTGELEGWPSRSRERQLLWHVRYAMATTRIQQLWRDSRLRVVLVTLLTATFWALMFYLFSQGFSLLHAAVPHAATLARAVHGIFNVFFLSLLLMLTISAGILFYGAVYRAADTPLLLTLPVRCGRITLEKLLDAATFACWGFFVLSSPVLLAYGVVVRAPWSFYGLILPLLLSFALVASTLGDFICLLLVLIAPRLRTVLLGAVVAGLLAAAIYFVWSLLGDTPHEAMSIFWLQHALGRMQLAERHWLPSWWLSSGLLEAAHGRRAGAWQGLGFTCALLSQGLVQGCILAEAGQRWLRTSFGQREATWNWNWRMRLDWLDRAIEQRLWPLTPTMRRVLVKDLRLFRRDPLQWSQFLLFFGLLAFYFTYVRRFDYGQQLLGWMTAIGFLNLCVVGLILSTFTTRFVFPLISLEGQRFWILGTAPIPRGDILWAKFWFATFITSIPCCILVFLSDVALQLWSRTPAIALMHQFICIELAIGLSSMAVGLGARFPNFRGASAAMIAAGFGGTMTLILSAVFVLVVILAPAIPAYARYAHTDAEIMFGSAIPWTHSFLNTEGALVAGLALSFVITLSAVVVPLTLGFRSFQRGELS